MDIYSEILAGLKADVRQVLATIISSTGSTPVPPGSKMLVRERAEIPLGTVGGGCVEGDVQEAARQLLTMGGKTLIRRFTLTEDDIESGMLCGGCIDILIELIPKEQSEVYSTLLSRRASGTDSAVITLLGGDQSLLGKSLVSPSVTGTDVNDLRLLRRISGGLPASFSETVRRAIERQAVTRIPSAGAEFIIEPVIGLQDLFIFGGGHVSKYVSRSAAMAGFRVTVIDDRPEYANPQRFPEAYRTLAVGFDDSWNQLQIKPSTSIVIVTRGHKFDERVLERAVQTQARYIGMIGSKRKVISTFANLVERAISRDLLRKVRAPIGLGIGALTAEEIGISITAELIAVRRGNVTPAGAMSEQVAEFFQTGAYSKNP
ncbi:MAG: XdhC family protein [Bacteroidota bacterium]